MMQNKERGILEIVTLGRSYPFKLSTNALCTIENIAGKTVMEMTKHMGFTELRLCFWAGIHEFDEKVDIKEVGNIIDEIGWEAANALFLESLSYTFPNMKVESEANGADQEAKSEGESEKNSITQLEDGS
jgi:hypothetical protein